MLTKLKNHEIDGFLMWEPFPQKAVLQKYGFTLKKSSEIWPSHPDCVVAVAAGQIDKKSEQALIWAHLKATRFIKDPANREKVINYAMNFTSNDRATTEAALNNIRWEEFPDAKEFQKYYRELTASPVLTKKVTDLGYKSDQQFFTDFLDRTPYELVAAKLAQDPLWQPTPIDSKKTIRLGRIVPGLFHLATYVAEKEGYYQAVGLFPGKNLDIQDYPHGIAIMQRFKTGELDAAYVGVAPAALKRINDGVDIRIVAGVEGEDSSLVVRTDQNITSVADLRGKTLAIPAIGNVQYVLLQKALREAGLTTVIK